MESTNEHLDEQLWQVSQSLHTAWRRLRSAEQGMHQVTEDFSGVLVALDADPREYGMEVMTSDAHGDTGTAIERRRSRSPRRRRVPREQSHGSVAREQSHRSSRRDRGTRPVWAIAAGPHNLTAYLDRNPGFDEEALRCLREAPREQQWLMSAMGTVISRGVDSRDFVSPLAMSRLRVARMYLTPYNDLRIVRSSC